MKYVKYVLGALGAILLLFLVIGLIIPEVSYNREIMVDKSLAESWAVTQDEGKLAEWLDGFQKVEHISGTPGKVGAVSDVYFDNNGQIMSIRETITEIVPNESISMTYTSDFMNMDYTLSMSSLDNRTKIYSTTTAYGNGMFSKSMMALMGGSLRKQEDSNLENLKRTIEENTINYFEAAGANN